MHKYSYNYLKEDKFYSLKKQFKQLMPIKKEVISPDLQYKHIIWNKQTVPRAASTALKGGWNEADKLHGALSMSQIKA